MSFEHVCSQELPPEVDILFNGRRRVTRRFELGKNGNIDDAIFAAYGDADPATITSCTTGYAGLKLISQKVLPSQNPLKPSVLAQVFETLSDTLVSETDDDIDYDLNGLKRTTRHLIALPGVDLTAFIVGTQTFGTSPVQYLANLKVEQNDALTRVTAVYLQAGVVSKNRSPGEIIGTVANTWNTWRVDPTDAAAMSAAGAGAPLAGVVISDGIENVQGYNLRSVTTLSGTITGVKTTYTDPVQVKIPGVVTLTTRAVSIGSESGTVAVASIVPPRVKTVAATVTVEITTTPPNTVPQLAYNLEGVSCSVDGTQASLGNLGSDTFVSSGGNASITGRKTRLSIGADSQTYPNCYYVGGPATGTVSYTGAYQPNPADLDSSSIIMEALTNVSQNTLTGHGATAAGAAEGYYTTGVLQRRARPILTTLAGVVYWEVVTVSV